jgi:hypothetical protein
MTNNLCGTCKHNLRWNVVRETHIPLSEFTSHINFPLKCPIFPGNDNFTPTPISHSNGLFSLEMTTSPQHWKTSSIEPHWRCMDQQVEQNSHQLNFMNKFSCHLFHNQMSTIIWSTMFAAINNIKVTTQIVTRVLYDQDLNTLYMCLHVEQLLLELWSWFAMVLGSAAITFHYSMRISILCTGTSSELATHKCNMQVAIQLNPSVKITWALKKKKKNHFWNQRTNSLVAAYCVILPGSFILWPAPTPTTIYRCDVSSLCGEAAPALIFCVYWRARAGH